MLTAECVLDISRLPKECWRPVASDNQRLGERFHEREIEHIPTWIRPDGSKTWIPVRLRDYSPSGFALYCDLDRLRIYDPTPQDRISVKFSLSKKDEALVPCLIQNVSISGNGLRLGIKRLDQANPEIESDAQFLKGYLINTQKPILAMIANPFLYDEWTGAELLGIGPENSLILTVRDPSLFLVAGQSLQISFEVFSAYSGAYTGKILWTRIRENESVLFSISGRNIPFEMNNALGESFIQEWDCSPGVLKGYGFMIRRIKEQVAFSFLSSQSEYAQVLTLRRNAYVHAGKRPQTTLPTQLTTEFDPFSRIIVAYHKKELVATLTLNFGGIGSATFRSEGEFPGGKYPIPLPPKSKMIEAHSACTHKDYRGGDLLQGLFEKALRALVLSDRDWIITLVTPELWPLYERVGFKKTGASVAIAHLNNIEHHLILIHRNAVLFGTGVRLLDWTYFYGELMKDILDKRLVEIPTWRKTTVRVLNTLGRLAKSWLIKNQEKEYQKHRSKHHE